MHRFMSIFHNGRLRTMKANYHVLKGDIRVIRPLTLCRERMLREYAKVMQFPVINENCPACFAQPKERARIKSLLATQENLFPMLFPNLLQAMMPLVKAENDLYVAQVAGGPTASDAGGNELGDDED
jgi:tRNA 2-thiocytidine biosynthesis protein TtcA